MRSSRQSDAGYVPELDGLRAFAVVSVMLFHAGVPFLRGGFIGVDVFFVLSGFLITSLLLGSFDRHGAVSLKRFYIRRSLRLVPALLALLAVFAIVAPVLLTQAQARDYYVDAVLSLTYLSNWSRAFSFHAPYLLGHTWSLAVEWQFYLLWPFLLIVLLKAGVARRWIFATAAGLAVLSWLWRSLLFATGSSANRVFNGLDTRFDALMLGCALAIVLSSPIGAGIKSGRARTVLKVSTPVAVLALAAFAVLGDWTSSMMVYFGYFLVPMLAALLIVSALSGSNKWLSAVLSNRWCVWIGSISYGLYLWHYPIFRVIGESGLPHVKWVIVSAGIVLTFCFASASYYLLEVRALRLKDRFRQATVVAAVTNEVLCRPCVPPSLGSS